MKAGKRYKQAGNICGHTVVDGTYPLGEMHLTDRMDYVERIFFYEIIERYLTSSCKALHHGPLRGGK